MESPASRYDWDVGNLAKCQKHGVSVAEIEALLKAYPPLAGTNDTLRMKTAMSPLGATVLAGPSL
jgi:uncharacterized DUF497 family protein